MMAVPATYRTRYGKAPTVAREPPLARCATTLLASFHTVRVGIPPRVARRYFRHGALPEHH
jgi:hypothetical protein